MKRCDRIIISLLISSAVLPLFGETARGRGLEAATASVGRRGAASSPSAGQVAASSRAAGRGAASNSTGVQVAISEPVGGHGKVAEPVGGHGRVSGLENRFGASSGALFLGSGSAVSMASGSVQILGAGLQTLGAGTLNLSIDPLSVNPLNTVPLSLGSSQTRIVLNPSPVINTGSDLLVNSATNSLNIDSSPSNQALIVLNPSPVFSTTSGLLVNPGATTSLITGAGQLSFVGAGNTNAPINPVASELVGSSVPEPGTIGMLSAALAGLLGLRRDRRRRDRVRA